MTLESAFYTRHLQLPGFNQEEQDLLRSSKVLVIGLGGLGCPAALYLAGAGVGALGLCDGDRIALSNLHRQILFDFNSVGENKVDIAQSRLKALNPFISVDTICANADAINLPSLLTGYDLVLDCTDNFETKFAISDACRLAKIPLVYGALFQFSGQVSTFHFAPELFSYRDLFPTPPPSGLAENCAGAGVLGPLAGIVGIMQANEAIKLITGVGTTLSGNLLIFDSFTGQTRILKMRPSSDPTYQRNQASHSVSPAELRAALSGNLPLFLLDVRDVVEHENDPLGGVNVPLARLHEAVGIIPPDRQIIAYCKSGVRSARAALYLASVLPGASVRSLIGGLDGFDSAAAS